MPEGFPKKSKIILRPMMGKKVYF